MEMSGQDPMDGGGDPTSVQDPSASLAAIAAERDRLVAEKTELNDRLLRSQAEFQNFRKRAERERVELFEYASMEAVRVLLPILDDFERAVLAASADGSDDEYHRGMKLIYQRYIDALKKLGLEPIYSQGQPFDPQIHHAVDMVETDEAPDHTILQEYQRGYNFKGRMLRPAMVKVAVQPASK
jgi:molecular chaperone GrpE